MQYANILKRLEALHKTLSTKYSDALPEQLQPPDEEDEVSSEDDALPDLEPPDEYSSEDDESSESLHRSK